MRRFVNTAIIPAMFMAFAVFCAQAARAAEAAGPRIVPAPKKIALRGGSFMPRKGDYILIANPGSAADRFAASLVAKEIELTRGIKAPPLDKPKAGGRAIVLGTLKDPAVARLAAERGIYPTDLLSAEGYVLSIGADGILLAGADEAGSFYAAQTLRSILRQTPKTSPLQTLRIDDWPDFEFRGITDDISRGPVPTMATIKQTLDRLAELKINKFNFYIEHAFCFEKHPAIGPKGGCVSAADIREIDEYSKKLHIELVGGLQSFGHMRRILGIQKYSHMAESPFNPWGISPANKDTYPFMDELYSETAPAFSSKFFNISCDETYDLGQGQSKKLVSKYGIAAVYAGHINKLHELLSARGKRVLMWADIALKHPDILGQLPKDLIFLPWEYGPRESFKDMLEPISLTGHDFIVCPGVNCWGRMFPNINAAEINIGNFARDGALYKALGVLNTTWDDDGENLFGYNWYPVAWGAETSWNTVSSSIKTFRSSYSQSFYGTSDDSAARGTRKLAEAGEIFDYKDLRDGRYWNWPPSSSFPSAATAMADAKRLRALALDAEELFIEAKKTATANRENLDYQIFAARRIVDLANRNISYYKNMKIYKTALAQTDPKKSAALLEEIRAALKKDRESALAIKKQYRELWLRENNPYWLDKNMAKYDELAAKIASASGFLAKAAADAEKGLPPASEAGFDPFRK